MNTRADSRNAGEPAAMDETRDTHPPSPCISLCTLDDNKLCLGCGRSILQISRWPLMNKDEQWAVIDQLACQMRLQSAAGNGEEL